MSNSKIIQYGETVVLKAPASEVMLHMRLTDKPIKVRLTWPHKAEVLPGEAGIFYNEGTMQYYCYPVEES